jgi:hypothetical protein
MFILLPNVSNAQFGALKRAIDKQIDHKIDSSIEQSAQNEQDKKAKEENEQNQAGDPSADTKSTAKADIRHNDEYDFTGRIFMKMEAYDKKGVIKSDYFTYFNASKPDAGIEMQTVDPKDNKTVITMTYIFDMENRAFMVLLTNADPKMGSISSIPSDSAMAANAKEREANRKKPVITKTGNSRMIAGYRCDEYKLLNQEENTYSLLWMTKDVKIKADKRNWGRAGMPTYYNYPEFEGSFMLAIQAFDKDNNPKLKVETVEIDENYRHSVSTVGYTFTRMNFFPGGKSGK